MNKIILVLFSIFISACHNSHKCCKGSALLIPKHSYIAIYDKPNGIQVDSVINDTINEDYVLIFIKQIKGKYAQIIAQNTISNNIEKSGWIELNNIGINPASTSPLFLYKKTNEYSGISDTIINPHWGDLYPIIKCKGEWLYIRTKENGKWKQGWMSPKDQCDNPYTTCN